MITAEQVNMKTEIITLENGQVIEIDKDAEIKEGTYRIIKKYKI